MAKRRPQINFQVDEPMKLLYEEAKLAGHWVTRFCAAGLLMMVENPRIRVDALNRLREWETAYADADAAEIRDFVQGAQDALQRAARDTPRAPKARPARKAAKRSKGA
jgi:hypothetical protein